VVVVLPLVPVIAMTSASITRHELELAADGHPAGAHRDEGGQLERHARAHDYQIRVRKRGGGMAARPERAAELLEAAASRQRSSGLESRRAATAEATDRARRRSAPGKLTTDTVFSASHRR
jgi:hypothetical protein